MDTDEKRRVERLIHQLERIGNCLFRIDQRLRDRNKSEAELNRIKEEDRHGCALPVKKKRGR